MLNKILPHAVYVSLLSIVIIFCVNYTGKISHDYSEQTKELSRLSDVRARRISDALEEERRAKEEIVKRMQGELDRNKDEYEKKIAELTNKKSKEVKQFVEQKGSDVKGMADSLSKATGFKVYDGK
jgi:ribosomal protein S17E